MSTIKQDVKQLLNSDKTVFKFAEFVNVTGDFVGDDTLRKQKINKLIAYTYHRAVFEAKCKEVFTTYKEEINNYTAEELNDLGKAGLDKLIENELVHAVFRSILNWNNKALEINFKRELDKYGTSKVFINKYDKNPVLQGNQKNILRGAVVKQKSVLKPFVLEPKEIIGNKKSYTTADMTKAILILYTKYIQMCEKESSVNPGKDNLGARGQKLLKENNVSIDTLKEWSGNIKTKV